ncbi:MAG: hypothetical protein ABSG36_09270 [Acidimicrobiales bacterium]
MPDRFVATDTDGLQHHDGYRRQWPLPVPEADSWRPGEVLEPDEHGAAVTLSASELLGELGERIFLAEAVGELGSARLVAGTLWSELTAAMFALDCVEHVLGIVPGSAEAELPGGGTLGAIIASARDYISEGGRTDTQKLGLVSRIAAARRLRRESTAIGDAAFTAATQAEGLGVDIWSDPAWETLAAARDAVLAAVEAVRHVALPFLAERETRKYEALEERKSADVGEVDTPWGRFAVGGGGPRYVPSWVSARDAAERARQAAADLGGPEVGDAEQSWQVERLLERLGTE